MDEDRSIDRLMTDITAIEMITKAQLVAEVEERLTTNTDKVAAVTTVSIGLANAAIHACVGAVEGGDLATGELGLGLVCETLAKEIRRLVAAVEKARSRRNG